MQLCKKCLEVFGAEVHFSYRLLKGDLKRIRKRLNLNQITLPLSFHSYLDAGFTSSWAGEGIQTAPTLMKENSRSMWYECITQL